MDAKSGARLLVIDDDKAFRELVADCFGGQGHQVVAATDGLEGFRLATRERFDLIVLDIRMANLDGVETRRSMQMVEQPAKVVIVSGFLTDQIVENCREAGALAVLSKPVSLQRLRETVQSLLGAEPQDADA